MYRRELSVLKKQYVEISKVGGFMTPPQKCLQEKGKQFISIVLASKERGIITTADMIDYLSVKHKYLDRITELSAK